MKEGGLWSPPSPLLGCARREPPDGQLLCERRGCAQGDVFELRCTWTTCTLSEQRAQLSCASQTCRSAARYDRRRCSCLGAGILARGARACFLREGTCRPEKVRQDEPRAARGDGLAKDPSSDARLGLTADDLELLIDGKLQPIYAVDSLGIDQELLPEGVSPAVADGMGRGLSIVLFFDLYHLDLFYRGFAACPQTKPRVQRGSASSEKSSRRGTYSS